VVSDLVCYRKGCLGKLLELAERMLGWPEFFERKTTLLKR
jgi:hypothetical protein